MKRLREKTDDIAAMIRVDAGKFLDIPNLDCRIASDILRYSNGMSVSLNFAEAQMLTRTLSRDMGLKARLPTIEEDYMAFQKLEGRNKSHQSEWKAEFLDGSFLMLNPEVRRISHSREYDFYSPSTSLIEVSRYSRFKDNGSSCWLGISKDKYDRAAFASSSYNGRYAVAAVPPLSKECLGVRLLIDEK